MQSIPSILALGFLTPLLFGAGAAATSIPIVIHLLNKRRFRIVVWAAMDWLLAAQRRNARRLRFQRWLLLAVRCLALLCIAAGIAELMLQSAAFAGLVDEKHATVIVWDDSYSMGYQQNAADINGANTAFEKSRRLIRDYIQNLPQGQTVMVIRASAGAAAASEITKPIRDHPLVLEQQVNHVQLSDSATDLPGAFERAAQVLHDLGPATSQRELVLLTDFTVSSIHDPRRGAAEAAIEGAAGNRLKNAASAAIGQATEFHLINVGAKQQENLAVTDLHTLRPIVVSGHPAELQVEVFNASDKPALDVPVSLLVDGAPAASAKIPRLEPASFQTAQMTIQVASPGRHLVEAQIPDDLLPADNVRRLMLNVRKDISVLLVDGVPSDGGRTTYGSTYFLQAAYLLSGTGKPTDVFACKTIPEPLLPTTPLANEDVVVLSEVTRPDPVAREALNNYVASGGLLIIFPGSHANAEIVDGYLGTEEDPQNDHWAFVTQSPAEGWFMADFKDDAWNTGRGGYGSAHAATPWDSDDLWLRRTFDRSAEAKGAFTVSLQGLASAQVYVNGNEQKDVGAGNLLQSRDVALPESAFKTGRNVIAIHARAPAQRSASQPPYVNISSVNLLPARLGAPAMPGGANDPTAYKTFDPEGFIRNPVMQTFAADENAGHEVGFLTVHTTQYFKLFVPTDGTTETILRYAGKQGTAAAQEDAAVVLRRQVGADPARGLPGGNVVLFASSADTFWNTWGSKPSFEPFMHELTFYGLGRGSLSAGGGLTLGTGATFTLPSTLASSGPWNGPRHTQLAVSTETRGGQSVIVSPPLWYAGTYAPASDDHPVVAVNPDPREADVRSVQKEQMAAALGANVKDVLENPTALRWNAAGTAGGGDYGPLMLLLALCLFVLESILALAFSTYR